ncbi:MAG TPA: hypothetical protein VHG91_06165 [Longimicrobium sp.]|nr:hypothetical protein [Longimicrobium sp.]
MRDEEARSPREPEALEIEPLPDAALQAVAGVAAGQPAWSEGPTCCSFANCSLR